MTGTSEEKGRYRAVIGLGGSVPHPVEDGACGRVAACVAAEHAQELLARQGLACLARLSGLLGCVLPDLRNDVWRADVLVEHLDALLELRQGECLLRRWLLFLGCELALCGQFLALAQEELEGLAHVLEVQRKAFLDVAQVLLHLRLGLEGLDPVLLAQEALLVRVEEREQLLQELVRELESFQHEVRLHPLLELIEVQPRVVVRHVLKGVLRARVLLLDVQLQLLNRVVHPAALALLLHAGRALPLAKKTALVRADAAVCERVPFRLEQLVEVIQLNQAPLVVVQQLVEPVDIRLSYVLLAQLDVVSQEVSHVLLAQVSVEVRVRQPERFLDTQL